MRVSTNDDSTGLNEASPAPVCAYTDLKLYCLYFYTKQRLSCVESKQGHVHLPIPFPKSVSFLCL